MNTLRNELKANYSQIPNELITDLTLSSGALRVLLYLFTKPDNWNVYNADICKQLDISEKTLTKYWNELLSSKWLRREKKQTKDGKFTGGYSYLIGSFTISVKSSESVKSSDHSNNIPIQKKETNKTNNTYNKFIEYLKANCKYKSKVTITKEGKELFNQIEDKKQLANDYIKHQEEKGDYAVRITKYMEDYNTVYKDKTNSNDEWSDGVTRCDPNEYK